MTILKVVPLSLLAVVAVVGGCSQGKASIGDEPDAQVKSGMDAFVGNWDGYMEAYTFSDGSDRVRLTIQNGGKSTVRFGDQGIWPLPTSPTDTYPPTFPATAGLPSGTAIPTIWSGYLFDLGSLQIDATRLKATALSTQLFDTWCKLQTSYHLAEADVYACLPCDFAADYVTAVTDGGENSIMCRSLTSPCWSTADGNSLDWSYIPITCEQEALCANGIYSAGIRTGTQPNAICACDASGCGVAATSPDITLDATLVENQQTLTGSLVFGDTNRTIWLQRQ